MPAYQHHPDLSDPITSHHITFHLHYIPPNHIPSPSHSIPSLTKDISHISIEPLFSFSILSIQQNCTANLSPDSLKVFSPSAGVCVSPLRTAASVGGVASRKKSIRNLLNDSDASGGGTGTGVPPLHTQGLGEKGPRSPANKRAHALGNRETRGRDTGKHRNQTYIIYVILLLLSIALCAHVVHTETRWRTINTKLDDITTLIADLKELKTKKNMRRTGVARRGKYGREASLTS